MRTWTAPALAPDDVARWADGRPSRLTGRVVRPPARGPRGQSLLLETRWLKPLGRPAVRVRGRVAVFTPAVARLSWGDRAVVWGPLAAPRPSVWPGSLGEAARLRRRGARARLFAPSGRVWRSEPAGRASPLRWVVALRNRCGAVFAVRLPPDRAALLSGIVLGHRAGAGPLPIEDFRRSGTVHLLVASGSNVGFALALWWGFARWGLWWSRRAILAAVPFWAFLYAGVAGGDAPVLRAAFMASAAALGRLTGRWDRVEQPLFLSAGILLAANPENLFDPGFQMSYVATLALAAGISADDTNVSEPPAKEGAARRWIAAGARWSAAGVRAQLALAPLLLFYFGRFSLAGIVANVAAVPLAALAMAGGVALAAADAAGADTAARVLAGASGAVVDGLARWAGFCARWPGAEIHRWCTTAQAAVLGAAVFALLWTAGRALRWRWAAALGVGVLIAWRALEPTAPPGPRVLWAGRDRAVVQTAAGAGLLEFGAPSETGDSDARRFVRTPRWTWRGGPEVLAGGRTPGADGCTVWEEGGMRFMLFAPPGGGGWFLRLEASSGRVLFAVEPTADLAARFAAIAPKGVDVLAWRPRPGEPAALDALGRVPCRRFLFLGRTPSRSVRRRTTEVPSFDPSRGALVWEAGPGGARFSALTDPPPAAPAPPVW